MDTIELKIGGTKYIFAPKGPQMADSSQVQIQGLIGPNIPEESQQSAAAALEPWVMEAATKAAGLDPTATIVTGNLRWTLYKGLVPDFLTVVFTVKFWEAGRSK